jgi:hypothetical protein
VDPGEFVRLVVDWIETVAKLVVDRPKRDENE